MYRIDRGASALHVLHPTQMVFLQISRGHIQSTLESALAHLTIRPPRNASRSPTSRPTSQRRHARPAHNQPDTGRAVAARHQSLPAHSGVAHLRHGRHLGALVHLSRTEIGRAERSARATGRPRSGAPHQLDGVQVRAVPPAVVGRHL